MGTVNLFVYGTLMPDQPGFHLLAAAVTSHREADLPGADLYSAGWYPLAAAGQGSVHGVLLEIVAEAWPALAERLDRYEGDEYQLVRRAVRLSGAIEPAEAWVYLAEPTQAERHLRIDDGDWRAHLMRNGRDGDEE